MTAVLAGATALLLGFLTAGSGQAPLSRGGDQPVVTGEARRGSLTLALAPPVTDIVITGAKGQNRPLVVIDPGHGGQDPGAPGVSGTVIEKQLTLTLARELRDRLAQKGRVRVALTRDDDRYLRLEDRARIAHRLGADLFLSLHADSARNPLARGASVYSLSEVASDAAAAQLARVQNGDETAVTSERDGSVRHLLADLAVRDEMQASAEVADRLVRTAGSRLPLRPDPHQFASFLVLRTAAVPAVLVEVGYLSNVQDEAMLRSPDGRAKIVDALADTIERDLALRGRR